MIQFIEVLNPDGSEMGMMNVELIAAIRPHPVNVGECEAMLHSKEVVNTKLSYIELEYLLCQRPPANRN